MKVTIHIPRWRMRVVALVVWMVRAAAFLRLVRLTRRNTAQLGDSLASFVASGITIGKRRKRLR